MRSPFYPRRRLAPSRLVLWLCGIALSSLLSAQVPGARQVDPRLPVTRAYSPFDKNTPARPLSPDQYDKSRVLIKLKPEALAAASGPTKMSGATFGVAGLGEVKRVFPTAQAPAQKASSAAAGEPPPPDLRLWQQAEVTSGADVLRLIEELKKSSLVATAEADVLYRLSDEGIVPPPSTSASPTQVATSGVPQRASATAIPDGSKDPLMASQWHLDAAKVKEAWAYLAGRNLPPGGNRDIVIAVIDSGVDYTHPDLAPNMWVNSREIAGNGSDDDNNGIVDDVYGASFIGSDRKGNPMDDHGHGTHVAGIIAAAANNGIGGVGIAYNCRIMAIKAAQYSGVLSSTNISEAIIYAVEKGADIINMSFGGSAQSKLVEDALAVAFGQAVLVAAAGNAGKHNEAPPYLPAPAPMFPAAYIYVLGTMAQQQAANAKGEWLAGFSNWDSVPNSRIEYELMAPGVAIPSTLPGNQYAAWSGTSMAAPVVSGIAALVRTRYPDKNTYSSRFIMGQIASTGSKLVGKVLEGGSPLSYYSADALKAVSSTPEPELKFLDYWIFDQPSIAAGNDGDGIIDAGETIDLAIVIKNRWGKADQVSVKLSAEVEGAVGPAPYITWITDTVDYGAVGNFGEDDNGLIYNANGLISGVRFPFRFKVAADCPNEFVIPFKVTMTCRNGFDTSDPKAPYTFTDRFSCVVQKGRVLPSEITSSMELTPDVYWIIDGPVRIAKGAVVTVRPGTQIQFWSADPKAPYEARPYPYLHVEGEFHVAGSESRPVELFPSSRYPDKPVCIYEHGSGLVTMSYFRLKNPFVGIHFLYSFGNDAGKRWISRAHHGYVTQDLELFLKYPGYGIETSIFPTFSSAVTKYVRFDGVGRAGNNSAQYNFPASWTIRGLGGNARFLFKSADTCLFDNSRVVYSPDFPASYGTVPGPGQLTVTNSVLLVNFSNFRSPYGGDAEAYPSVYYANPSAYGYSKQPGNVFSVSSPAPVDGSWISLIRAWPDDLSYLGSWSDIVNFVKFIGAEIVTLGSISDYARLASAANSSWEEPFRGDRIGLPIKDSDGDGNFRWTNGKVVSSSDISFDSAFRRGQPGYVDSRGVVSNNLLGTFMVKFPRSISRGELDQLSANYLKSYGYLGYRNNAILNQWWRADLRYWLTLTADSGGEHVYSWSRNYWGGPQGLSWKKQYMISGRTLFAARLNSSQSWRRRR
ncbi:MAG: S8 family serine peptidase [Opitutaceae bacterium]